MSTRRWYQAMKSALYIETPILEIKNLMDNYDPIKRIGLIIDEWGTWWGVEKGINPAFLYQQNTLADALIAAIHLDIFNRHCDRVHMANIAQTVNVLQSMIFHIFNMYKHHQDNKLLPLNIISNDFIHEKFKLPAINGSASIDKENNICLSLTNLNPEENYEIECDFLESRINKNEINATILTSESLNAHNSFESPDNVRPENYPIDKFKISNNRLSFEIPSKSVLFITLTQLE